MVKALPTLINQKMTEKFQRSTETRMVSLLNMMAKASEARLKDL